MKKSCKKIIIIVSCIIVFLLSLSIILLITGPKLSLIGEKEMALGLDETYQEKGVKATFLGEDISRDVKITGEVDTHKEGRYIIEYEYQKVFVHKKVKRIINVKDMEAPTLELTGKTEVNLCKNQTYQEEGYKAIDNLDGDITENVQIITQDDKIIYQVKDKNGNKQEAIRKILYHDDTTPPKITLSGNQTYTIYKGAKYQEPGYQVTDDCDSDLTSKVKVTNKVDTSKVGTYEVIYEVEDKSANKTTVKRQVRVIERAQGGTIYLTFDDGPLQGVTNVILDILKEEGVKATFFVTSNGPDSLISREFQEGHTVALHTWSHNYASVYSSVNAYFNDLQKIHDRVLRITGEDAKIIRFPGGSSNTVSRNYQKGIMSTLTKEVLNRGYSYFDWNVDSKDAGGANSKNQVYQNVINSLSSSKYNVVLMHDVKGQTRDALRDIIRYAKENNFTFQKITAATPMVRHSVNN